MLSRISKAAQGLAPIALRTGLTRFFSTSHSPPSSVMDNLSDFDPNKTYKILRHVDNRKRYDLSVNLRRLLTLDTISETPYSTTHRALDKYHKNLVAVRTFKLETHREWNQVNLALRQFHVVKPTLGKVLAMDYNEQNKEVKIITELGKSTAGEYSYFRIKNEKPWTPEELRLLYLNIVNQLNALREFGGVCEAIKPRNMYYDPKAEMLKLYDLSDFDAVKGYGGVNLDDKVPINIDSAIHSLVQIINPYAPVHNSEEAQAYLRANHSDFLTEFETLQDKVKGWQFQQSEVVRNQLEDLLKNPKTQWFSEHQYEQFFLSKMESVWEAKGLSKSLEEWATLNQGLGNYIEAINTLQQQLAKTLDGRDENNRDTTKVYGNLASVYQAADNLEKASEYFEKAIKAGESCSNMDKIVMAQIYNSYGKFLRDQKKYTEALDFFTKAEKILVGTLGDTMGLGIEIDRNKWNAQHPPDRRLPFSWLFRILSYIVFIKVACSVIKKIQKKLDQLPNYNLKQSDLISPPNPAEATSIQKDQPLEKSEPPVTELKPQALKSENKQIDSVSHEDLSADKSGSQEGTTFRQSLLFGAMLVISAIGLTL